MNITQFLPSIESSNYLDKQSEKILFAEEDSFAKYFDKPEISERNESEPVKSDYANSRKDQKKEPASQLKDFETDKNRPDSRDQDRKVKDKTEEKSVKEQDDNTVSRQVENGEDKNSFVLTLPELPSSQSESGIKINNSRIKKDASKDISGIKTRLSEENGLALPQIGKDKLATESVQNQSSGKKFETKLTDLNSLIKNENNLTKSIEIESQIKLSSDEIAQLKNSLNLQNSGQKIKANNLQKDIKENLDKSKINKKSEVFRNVINSKENPIYNKRKVNKADSSLKEQSDRNFSQSERSDTSKLQNEINQGIEKSESMQTREASSFSQRLGSTAAERETLISELREKTNQQIVKESTVLLKKDGAGEIRLILKPERLGSVRIRLLLEDNHIAGKIIVDNNSVKEIFQENLNAMRNAFEANGFSFDQLDVSVSGGESQNQRQHQQSNNRNHAVRTIEENILVLSDAEESDSLVDMVI